MTIEEYFGEWLKVISDKELLKITKNINILYKTKYCSPNYKDIFKVFNITPYKNLHTVMLFNEPYFNNKATGIALGNRKDDINLSTSLDILKEAVIDYTVPHYGLQFDNTLESWCKQGILMLNTSLTVEKNKPGSHNILWKNFMINFIKNLNKYNPGLIWILWGNEAKFFKRYITYGHIIENHSLTYYDQNNIKLDKMFFNNLTNMIKYYFDIKVKWYKEYSKDINDT